MNTPLRTIPHSTRSALRHATGSVLAETILSVGLLALAIPWLHAAWSAAKDDLNQAAVEDLAHHACTVTLSQIDAARDGKSSSLPPIPPGTPIPPANEIWALGFGPDGSLLGRVAPERYQSGCRADAAIDLQQPAACLMRIDAAGVSSGTTPPIPLRLILEYPASKPAASRHKHIFHTLIP